MSTVDGAYESMGKMVPLARVRASYEIFIESPLPSPQIDQFISRRGPRNEDINNRVSFSGPKKHVVSFVVLPSKAGHASAIYGDFARNFTIVVGG